MRKPFVAGNWKMNMSAADTAAFITAFKARIGPEKNIDIAICPPFPYLVPVFTHLKGSGIKLGAQNMHWEEKGAFTGEVSAAMLKDAGCTYIIIGHSERRQYFGETDRLVNRKIRKAVEKGLRPIVCVGETLEQRESGETDAVVCGQLEGALMDIEGGGLDTVTLAYEPVWAIGTGKTATAEQAQAVHRSIRGWIKERYDKRIADTIRIQYGGSVRPDNAADMVSQPDIDGALVGGASLDADDFAAIIEAVSAQVK